jgi:hypothetical protein
MFENMVLRKILGPKKEAVRKYEDNSIMRSIMLYTVYQILLWSTNYRGRDEKSIQSIIRKTSREEST